MSTAGSSELGAIPEAIWRDAVQQLRAEGLALIDLPLSVRTIPCAAFAAAATAFADSSRLPTIPDDATAAHANGYHDANARNSLSSRYNQYRRGLVFSDGATLDNVDSVWISSWYQLETLLHDIANRALQAIEKDLSLPVGWFQETLGPTRGSSQWHLKEYVPPSQYAASCDDASRLDLQMLPLHTDPSLISVVVHDRTGIQKGAQGLRYRRPQPCETTNDTCHCVNVSRSGHGVAIILVGSVLSYMSGRSFPACQHCVAYCPERRAAATLFVRPQPDRILTVPPSPYLTHVQLKRRLAFEQWNMRVSRNYKKGDSPRLATVTEDKEDWDSTVAPSKAFLPNIPEESAVALGATCAPHTSAVDGGIGRNGHVEGVIFARSVRSSFCTLHVAPLDETTSSDSDSDSHQGDAFMVRLQFGSNVVELRSFCRRFCKVQDHVCFRHGSWQGVDETIETSWQAPRLVITLHSVDEAQLGIQVVHARAWKMSRVQIWQEDWLPTKQMATSQRGAPIQCTSGNDNKKRKKPCAGNAGRRQLEPRHGDGLEKRLQGEFVANVLFHVIRCKILACDSSNPEVHCDVYSALEWAKTSPQKWNDESMLARVGEYLNYGTGVVDAAGGSGHVSLALAKLGVQATVVDPRTNVGKLPSRDRKSWNRLLNDAALCQVIKPFGSVRAWIGSPPEFRHEDQSTLPICDEAHEIMAHCSAIVALHPDEATDAVVDLAVQLRVPVVIVPCCVFARLFQHRRGPNGQTVSTHGELLDYLQRKDASIRRGSLPFAGSNTVLWSAF